MKVQPWSHSRLEMFENCPRQFYEINIAKSIPREQETEELVWGRRVHKAFEDRLTDGLVLPAELEMHEPFMDKLTNLPGHLTAEEKISLNMRGEPCGYWDKDVWYRGGIDVKVVGPKAAYIVDHKTGKLHTKFQQLKGFALHTFAAHPEIVAIRAEYYWTQFKTTNGITIKREEIPQVWGELLPALNRYKQAFQTNTFNPKQSGLCNGWCPVTSCEFWREKRRR